MESAQQPVVVPVPVAWGEMDAFAHVNNTVYLRWFETARIAWFERVGMLERMERERVGPILARSVIDYRVPVTYPDTVDVAVRALKLGRTSLTLAYRVTSRARGGAIVAEGETVIVMIDYARGEKVPLDDALRGRIAALDGPV